MINCAHVSHFEALLEDNKDAKWFKRVRALRTNASRKSHEELDQSDSLDAGDPDEFGKDHVRLVKAFPHLNIIGGCCGTDIRHVRNFVETFQK
jgi:S-methylmethionine-dependent homocysteine/selenocysteine methylase